MVSTQRLMALLGGIHDKEIDAFDQGTQFFSFVKAKGENGSYWDGLYRTETKAALFGPRKNKNIEDRYYRIIFNYD